MVFGMWLYNPWSMGIFQVLQIPAQKLQAQAAAETTGKVYGPLFKKNSLSPYTRIFNVTVSF